MEKLQIPSGPDWIHFSFWLTWKAQFPPFIRVFISHTVSGLNRIHYSILMKKCRLITIQCFHSINLHEWTKENFLLPCYPSLQTHQPPSVITFPGMGWCNVMSAFICSSHTYVIVLCWYDQCRDGCSVYNPGVTADPQHQINVLQHLIYRLWNPRYIGKSCKICILRIISGGSDFLYHDDPSYEIASSYFMGWCLKMIPASGCTCTPMAVIY